MNRRSNPGWNKAEPNGSSQDESFEELIDTLFEELALAVQWQRPSILLATYGFENVRTAAENALERRLGAIGQQMLPFPVDESLFDIPLLLSKQPEREHAVFSVTGLSKGGGEAGVNAYRALNMRREYLVDYAIRVIFWLTKDEAVALSLHAPDFWAFRHRVVEFADTAAPASLQPDLDGQIAAQEALLGGLPRGAGSRSRRLELLSGLAALYREEGNPDRSALALRKSILIARELNDAERLARAWADLGVVYLEMGESLRAVRAGRKATRINPPDAGLWSELGHLYHVMGRIQDAIIAYKHAIRLDPDNAMANSSLMECVDPIRKL